MINMIILTYQLIGEIKLKNIIKSLVSVFLAILIFSYYTNSIGGMNDYKVIDIVIATSFIYFVIYLLDTTINYLIGLLIGDNKLEIEFKKNKENE